MYRGKISRYSIYRDTIFLANSKQQILGNKLNGFSGHRLQPRHTEYSVMSVCGSLVSDPNAKHKPKDPLSGA